jgi:uncharacterized protein (DUF1778 family)
MINSFKEFFVTYISSTMSHRMNSNLNFRLSSQDKLLIEHAAILAGLKSNTYARLLEAAERDIEELSNRNTLILNSDEWEQFTQILKALVKVNKHLKRAVAKFRKAFD